MEDSGGGEGTFTSPSFSSYSSNWLAEVAVRVAAESSSKGGDEDFEFALVRQDDEVSAENLFTDGEIGPVFPVFNRKLLLNQGGEFNGEGKEMESSVLVPLRKLLINEEEDREVDNPPSCSSSEADELENIPADTYCVWRPKAADQPSPSRWNKSRSTGSTSKRWSFRDLLRRSNSEGKDSFVFLTPKKIEEKSSSEAAKKGKGKIIRTASASVSASAHEALYVRNRAAREGHKKKSYLPYRQDIVGFFVNINGRDNKYPSLLLR